MREPVPSPGAVALGEELIPGYDRGVVGPDYIVAVAQAGCQGAPGAGCALNGETTLATEANLRDIGGTCRVTIEVDSDLQPQ